MRCSLLHGALIVAFCLHPTATHAEEKTLQLKQTIPLPGVEGRIDHLDLDAANERLFVCALGNNTAEVLDLRKGERIHTISGLGSPQGLVYYSELNMMFDAYGISGKCMNFN